MKKTPLELLHNGLEHIVDIQSEYEQYLVDYEERLSLTNKNIVKANSEQVSWLSFYDARRIELKSAVDFLDAQLQRTRGRLWKDYTEVYSRDLQARDKDNYINNEPKFLDMLELYLEIKELYDKFNSVVESFKARGYALNNITRIITSDAQDYTIQ